MTNNDQNNKKAVNEVGRFIGIGLAIGAGLGVALDNIGLGIAIGIALGAAIGALRSRSREEWEYWGCHEKTIIRVAFSPAKHFGSLNNSIMGSSLARWQHWLTVNVELSLVLFIWFALRLPSTPLRKAIGFKQKQIKKYGTFHKMPPNTARTWRWESARFQAVCVAWSWFRQNSVISARPLAASASRWAAGAVDHDSKESN
jgi:hypothetical protein